MFHRRGRHAPKNAWSRRKKWAVLLAVPLLVVGGVAGAVFLAVVTPTHGTGHVSVQQNAPTTSMTITDDGPYAIGGGAATPLAPGGAVEAEFTLTPHTDALVNTMSFNLAEDTSGPWVLDANNGDQAAVGCSWNWFTVGTQHNQNFYSSGVGTAPSGPAVTPFTALATGTIVGIDVEMLSVPDNQNACLGVAPVIDLSINGG